MSLDIDGQNYRQMTCEQKFINFDTVSDEYTDDLNDISQTLFRQNELKILEETIQTELILRAKMTFAGALNHLAPFAKESAIEFAFARNACSKNTELKPVFDSIDSEFLTRTPAGIEGQLLSYDEAEFKNRILDQIIEYHIATDIIVDEERVKELERENPLLGYIPSSGKRLNHTGKMIMNRTCLRENLDCMNIREDIKNSGSLESSQKFQILRSKINLQKDSWANNYLEEISQEYWKSYWSRVQSICEASHCSILAEDLETTELLIGSLQSDWTRTNAEKLACWCDIDAQREDELALAKLISGPSALVLGVGCIFTGGGVCVAGAIAGGTAGVVGLLDLNQTRENYQIVLNEAQRQSLVSLRDEVSQKSSQELLMARDELNSAILWSGVGLSVGGLSSLGHGSRLLNTLRQNRNIRISRSTNAHTSLVNQLDSGQLSRNPIIAVSDDTRGELWMMNLARLPGEDAPRVASELTQNYWTHVAGVYKKRLNLTDDEVDSFIESSRAMQDRTLLLVNRKVAEDGEEIIGGVAAVSSRSSSELLPLEKALDIQLPRNEGDNIIEIVRLTADSIRPEMARELIHEISKAAQKTSNPSRAFIYTSRVHARLYKRLGFPMNKVMDANDGRDVVMEVDFSLL